MIVKVISAVDGIVPPNSYVEAPTPSVNLFGDGVFGR